MRPEKKFWQEIKNKTPNVNWTRIESWASPGVPDLFGVFKDLDTNKGIQFWVELKCNKLQKVIISPKQIAWHYAHTKHGGVSYIFVRIRNRAKSPGGIAIFPGHMSRELHVHGLELLHQGSGYMIPDPWTGDQILKYLESQPTV